MPFFIVNKVITKMDVDIVVNSANTDPVIGFGVESSIYKIAGSKLFEDRKRIGKIEIGESRISNAYDLNAKHVIHTVSPEYIAEDYQKLLQNAYINPLKLAIEAKCNSIAFPLLSSGNNGLRREKAIEIAVDTITNFLKRYELDVYLVLYQQITYNKTKRISHDIKEYLEEYKDSERRTKKKRLDEDIYFSYSSKSMLQEKSIDDLFPDIEETFRSKLFSLIDEKDLNDVDVYKMANLTKKVFSKIRSNLDYQPTKRTAIAFAIALKLDIEETNDLLMRAGFTLEK